MKIASIENINFKAKLISQWSCNNAKNKTKNISIIAIEKSDLLFAENFVKYVEGLKNDNKTAKEIMDSASKTITEILKNKILHLEKIKMFIATYDTIPCGILIANMPKASPTNDGIVYSSRHNSAKNETEMDYLVTWSPKGNEKLKGIGKALIGEYFRTVKQDKFRDVYVRAEVPEKSYAKSFYESFGFEQIRNKRLRLFNKNSAQSIINDFTPKDDETIPMLITRSKIKTTAEELATKMNRKEFKEMSVDANILINISTTTPILVQHRSHSSLFAQHLAHHRTRPILHFSPTALRISAKLTRFLLPSQSPDPVLHHRHGTNPVTTSSSTSNPGPMQQWRPDDRGGAQQ